MRAIILCFLLILCACSQQAHHHAASDAQLEQLLHGMELTYRAAGMDTAIVQHKEHRNLAYRLALHLQDDAQRVQAIESGQATTADLHQYARSSIKLVHSQRPGYPVLPIITTLLEQDPLHRDQQLLLLACCTRLLAESGVISNSGPGS